LLGEFGREFIGAIGEEGEELLKDGYT